MYFFQIFCLNNFIIFSTFVSLIFLHDLLNLDTFCSFRIIFCGLDYLYALNKHFLHLNLISFYKPNKN